MSERRKRGSKLTNVVSAVFGLQRVRGQFRLFSDVLYPTISRAAQRDKTFCAQIRPFDSGSMNFIEKQVQCNEIRSLDIPVRLLCMALSVDCRHQRFAEQADGFAPDILR